MKEFFLNHNSPSPDAETLKNSIDTSKMTTYIFHFDSDFGNSKIIRDFVGEIFDAFKIIHPWQGRFILITDELINNAIEHGSSEGDINKCIITAGKRESDNNFYISLEVHDTGNGEKIDIENFENMKKEKTDPNNNEIYMGKRGRGLFHITEKIVDKLSFSQSEHGGLAVKIEKCITTDYDVCLHSHHETKV